MISSLVFNLSSDHLEVVGQTLDKLVVFGKDDFLKLSYGIVSVFLVVSLHGIQDLSDVNELQVGVLAMLNQLDFVLLELSL